MVDDLPKVSLVTATHFAGELLGRVLRSIAELDYPHESIEVIIVSTASDEEASLHVERFKKTCSSTVKSATVHEDNADKKRNFGIRLSDSDYVSVTDDDIILNKSMVRRALAIMSSQEAVAAVAYPAISEHPSLLERIHQGRFLGTTARAYALMPCTFFKRKALLEVGLYREDMGPPDTIHEDWELGSRLSKRGYKVIVDGTTPSQHLGKLAKRKRHNPGRVENTRKVKASTLARSALQYARQYLDRNSWSMFQALKVGPAAQLLEYALYLLTPTSFLILLALNVYWALVFLVAAITTSIISGLLKGYYRAFSLRERISYWLLLLSIRTVRAHLFLIGTLKRSLIPHSTRKRGIGGKRNPSDCLR
jgi:cellulose synthase/poly-beta-1,6-N-acetylglucosamine synthase-like glycosyltransferase